MVPLPTASPGDAPEHAESTELGPSVLMPARMIQPRAHAGLTPASIMATLKAEYKSAGHARIPLRLVRVSRTSVAVLTRSENIRRTRSGTCVYFEYFIPEVD